MVFNPNPYKAIENQEFPQEIIWDIKASHVHGVAPRDGSMLFLFVNCRFRKLVFKNNEEINFPDISIYFNTCVIEEIWVEDFKTKNMSLNFGSCIISGQVKKMVTSVP